MGITMKIKERLITAFLIIIIMPIILISCVTGVIMNYQESSIQQSYDVKSDTIQVLTNPIQILNRLTRGVYNDIKTCALKTPEKFEDKDYLVKINGELTGQIFFYCFKKK